MRALLLALAVGCAPPAEGPGGGPGLVPLRPGAPPSVRADAGAGIGQVDTLERLHIGRSPLGQLRVGWRSGGRWTTRAFDGRQWAPAAALDRHRSLPALDGAAALVGLLELAGQTATLGVAGGATEGAIWRRRTAAGHTTVLDATAGAPRLLDGRDPALRWVEAALPGPPLGLALDARDRPWTVTATGGTARLHRWQGGRWRPDEGLVLGQPPVAGQDPALQLLPHGDTVLMALCEDGGLVIRSPRRHRAPPSAPVCGTLVSTAGGLALVAPTDAGLAVWTLSRSGWRARSTPLGRHRPARRLAVAPDPEGGLLVAWTERLGWGAGSTLLQTGLPDGIYAAAWSERAGWTSFGPDPRTVAGTLPLGPGGAPMVAMNNDGDVILGTRSALASAGALQLWSPDRALAPVDLPGGAAVALALDGTAPVVALGTPSGVRLTWADAPDAPPVAVPPPPRPVGQRASPGPAAVFADLATPGGPDTPAVPVLATDWRTDGSLDTIAQPPARLLTTGGRPRLLSGTATVVEASPGHFVLRIPGSASAAPLPPGRPTALGQDDTGAPVLALAGTGGLHRWTPAGWSALPAPPQRATAGAPALAPAPGGLALLRASSDHQLWLDLYDGTGWHPAPDTAEGALADCGGPCGRPVLASGGGRLCAAWSSVQVDGPHPVLWCQPRRSGSE